MEVILENLIPVVAAIVLGGAIFMQGTLNPAPQAPVAAGKPAAASSSVPASPPAQPAPAQTSAAPASSATAPATNTGTATVTHSIKGAGGEREGGFFGGFDD
ncbi:hypothetical protein KGQ55_01485 [Patescibacteria group bacterium]|nr:hypothetical protein [Patescibacteria group bacterium]